MEKTEVRHYNKILISFLIGVSLFSIFKYVSSLKEKYALLSTVNKTKDQLKTLEFQKQNLLQEIEEEKKLQQKLIQENSEIKDDLKATDEELTKLNSDFIQADKNIEELSSQISVLKTENMALNDEKDKLKLKVNEISQEKESLKIRLSSIQELKKAIREIKQQMRKVTRGVKHKVKKEETHEGNRGFLLKEGKPTYPAKVRIEVHPAAINN